MKYERIIKILISRIQKDFPLKNINCFTYNPSYTRIFIKIKFFKIDKFSFLNRIFFIVYHSSELLKSLIFNNILQMFI